jgi:hypothetical protein
MTKTQPIASPLAQVPHKRITGEERVKLAAELIKKYQGGASIRMLAEETGRSYGFVHRLLLENDVELRGRGSRPRESVA